MARDYSREAAHRRYEKAAELSAYAGSDTQAGLNEAYRQLNENAAWTPEENWADAYQEGAKAKIPSWMVVDDNEDAFPAYEVPPEDKLPATMMTHEDLAKLGEDVYWENRKNAAIAYPELRPAYEKDASDRLSGYTGNELDWAKKRAKSEVMGSAWQNGDPEKLKAMLDEIDSWTTVPARYTVERRRWSGNNDYSIGPDMLGIAYTPDVYRDLYDYNFAKQGSIGRGENETWGAPHEVTDRAREEDTSFVNDWIQSPVVGENDIDNGANPASREKLMMTGRQYLNYRNNFGLPGRPVGEIDPNGLYNKQEELEDYGFIPYIVSNAGLREYQDNAVPQFISNLYDDLTNLRRANTDYSLSMDGQTYSGKDFAKSFQNWSNKYGQDDVSVTYAKANSNEYSIPRVLQVEDSAGTWHDAPAAMSGFYPGYMPDHNGQFHVVFENGDVWDFTDEDQFRELNSRYRDINEGEQPSVWVNIPPVELSDGRQVRYDRAKELYENQDDYADYGLFDFNKPAIENPFEEGGWIPWIADMVLSSAPYFYIPAAVPKAAADAHRNWNGYSVGRNYLNGTYNLLSENPNRQEQVTAALGSAAMPLTEQLWGKIGQFGKERSPFRAIANKVLGDKAGKVMGSLPGRIVEDAFNEGTEEIPGELVEEFQKNGLNWFMNPKYEVDENGNVILDADGNPIPARDKQGRDIKDWQSTTPADWFRNYLQQWPLAFTGGAILGAGMGLPSSIAMSKLEKEIDKAISETEELTPEDKMKMIQSIADYAIGPNGRFDDEVYNEYEPTEDDIDKLISRAGNSTR